AGSGAHYRSLKINVNRLFQFYSDDGQASQKVPSVRAIPATTVYKDARQTSRLSRFFNPTPPAITLALFSSVMASHVPAK
ncbi:hypothetical protein, partial [Stutzerimonas kunmingensis]|uniref:hypothetical protein n=1 Tax=Stutzerimonas kunmingensis TaxID=1211807 RepID=UPI0028B14A95